MSMPMASTKSAFGSFLSFDRHLRRHSTAHAVPQQVDGTVNPQGVEQGPNLVGKEGSIVSGFLVNFFAAKPGRSMAMTRCS